MRISVVIPVYNEKENIPVLAAEVAAALERHPESEVLFVDDGSADGTWDAVQAAAARHPFIAGLRFRSNRGQSAALIAGIRAARGEVVVTLDGDLQNNPADIPLLVEKLAECDVVCGYRARRKDTWSKRAASVIGNTVRKWFTHDGIRDTGCALRAFRRACVNDIPPVNGAHRFVPAYFRLNGRSIEQIPVDHRPRQFGSSKYTNLKRLPRTIFDLIGFLWYRRRLVKVEPDEATRR